MAARSEGLCDGWRSTVIADLALLDTNILVYGLNVDAPEYEVARQLRDRVMRGEVPGCLSAQVLTELLAVQTDPRRVQNPLSPAQVCAEVSKYLSTSVRVIHRQPETMRVLLEIVERERIAKQQVHDAALVATMLTNGVRRIYTANTCDFEKFDEIEVMNPFEP